MKKESFVKMLKTAQNNGIIVSNISFENMFSSQMSEVAYSQAISRLCREGILYRISKGVYAFPKQTKFGSVLPSSSELIDIYCGNTNGMIVGYTMYNERHLTTQISKCINIYSNKVRENVKVIGELKIVRVDLEFSSNIKNIIEVLEVLENYNKIQDLNMDAFNSFIQNKIYSYNEEDFRMVIKNINYHKRTLAFYRMVLNHFGIQNTVSTCLSSMSKYDIPNLEEIYKTKR